MDIFDDFINDDILFKSKIHLRIQKRSGKKSITVAEGFSEEINLPKISKYISKKCGCRCKIINNILELSGDQREFIYKFLINEHLVEKENIIIHGT